MLAFPAATTANLLLRRGCRGPSSFAAPTPQFSTPHPRPPPYFPSGKHPCADARAHRLPQCGGRRLQAGPGRKDLRAGDAFCAGQALARRPPGAGACGVGGVGWDDRGCKKVCVCGGGGMRGLASRRVVVCIYSIPTVGGLISTAARTATARDRCRSLSTAACPSVCFQIM
eukprot:12893-Chlamydomonas_euryale.AAC.1